MKTLKVLMVALVIMFLSSGCARNSNFNKAGVDEESVGYKAYAALAFPSDMMNDLIKKTSRALGIDDCELADTDFACSDEYYYLNSDKEDEE